MMMVVCTTANEEAMPGSPCGCANVACYFRHREDCGRNLPTRLPIPLRHLAISSDLGLTFNSPYGQFMRER
eukprot:1733278-Alexandrium_andersonii.AAC.1